MTTARCNVARRSERGAVVVEIPMVLGFLIIPVAFLILTVPTWLQGIHAANDGAAESARAFVLSGADPDAVGRALSATATSHGFDGRLDLASASTSGVGPGDEVTIVVNVELPAIALFDVGSFTYTATHVERYPSYVRTPR